MFLRSQFVALLTTLVLATTTASAAEPNSPRPTTPESTARQLIKPALPAIDKGLAYLVGQQNDDGSFKANRMSRNPAVVGLSGMALLSSGSSPGRGPYGKQLERCVDYLLSVTRPDGFIAPTGAGHGPMYGHGFATLFLAEVYGMSPNPELRDSLSRSIDLIVRTQNDEGGWRYDPVPRDADLSVTICQIMALRAARNAGLHVPKKTIDACEAYVKKCQEPDGGFSYTLQNRGSAFPRSAAGVVSLYSAGIYEGPEIEKGLKYLDRFVPKPRNNAREAHYFYGQYYGAQAMWHAGGDRWQRWYPAIQQCLLQTQQPNGAWQDSVSPEYATSMSLIVLQMPNNMLPIFQR